MIIVIDNYDSFVFNVARYFHTLGEATQVIRNDAITVNDLLALEPRALVCSPCQAGISTSAIRELSGRIPILGICLGHQCIGSVFGGDVTRARRPMHCRSSRIAHDGQGLFEGVPSPLNVGRYHSLIVELVGSCSPDLIVTAHSEEGEIMALAHRDHSTFGVQFHPESILTEQGHTLLRNVLRHSTSF
ncbi:aminodeoxychorismate/anthranilate synthase component II [Bradyrhizobium sp. ERR14]|uniref:anthranilate synthase component II n=1 Tax=Bradyrhizobium sp. ERR14 TaxID=2663837 RepID=UPI00161B0602|nr:aminodeoxychorismate/anthranilate synthase component II [Bradyrhizobium sp. ERR14]MBB4398498.1 para-aminobenzoate synthetase component 2 [Bradyrhizobium sp. ERR14]